MTGSWIAFFAAGLAQAAMAQGQGSTQQAAAFPQGFWTTSADVREAVIAINVPPRYGPFIFSVGNGFQGASPNVTYEIVRDGQALQPNSLEGNYAAVQGTNLSVRQLTPGASLTGIWKVLAQHSSYETHKVQWAAIPAAPVGAETLVANLAEDRLLLIGTDANDKCTGVRTQISVNDKPLLGANNAPLQWLAGSSVLTFGRKVAVRTTGTCQLSGPSPNLPMPVSGTLEFVNLPIPKP